MTEFAEAYPGIENRHMNAIVEGETLRFDHRVRPGILTQSSAAVLLKAAGLPPRQKPAPDVP